MPRALVLDGPRQLRLAEQDSPPLQAGEARLRARLSGISHGTELNLYRGTSAFMDKVFDRGLRAFVTPHAGSAAAYPVTLGYEMVSEVVEVAPDVTAVKVGDLVHTGTPHQEETVLDVAASLAATYPLVVLPTDERLERALFISLAAVALQAVHDAEIKLGDSVSVHGMGAIGLMAIQMCLLEGIQNVFAVDPDPRAARARHEVRGHGRARPDRPRAGGPAGPRPQPRARRGRGDRGVRLGPGPAGGAGRRGAERHGGRGRLLPGRGGPRASRRGVPPQPAVPDRLHRRLGNAEPARAAVGPPPRPGRRHPPALHRPRLGGRPARPDRAVRPGPGGVRVARRASAGRGEGRADYEPGAAR